MLDQDKPPAFLLQSQLLTASASLFLLGISFQPPSSPVADPAAIPWEWAWLLASGPAARTAGLRAVPEILGPSECSGSTDSQRRELRKVLLILRQLHEVTNQASPCIPGLPDLPLKQNHPLCTEKTMRLNHTKTNGDSRRSMNQCYGEEGGGTDEEELVFVICFIYIIIFKLHNSP